MVDNGPALNPSALLLTILLFKHIYLMLGHCNSHFCRFLALKNLATVFLQQGAPYYKDALQCYLQAVEIDNKDSVVWNKLGTLACSIGMLSISRWAFEQGLYCSPNNCEHFISCLSSYKLSYKVFRSHDVIVRAPIFTLCQRSSLYNFSFASS